MANVTHPLIGVDFPFYFNIILTTRETCVSITSSYVLYIHFTFNTYPLCLITLSTVFTCITFPHCDNHK
jgi:hypothetical protein